MTPQNCIIWPPVVNSNMAAVGNNRSILWSPQNNLIICTFTVTYHKEHIGCILNLFWKLRSMIWLQTESLGWSFQDDLRLVSKPAHYKQQFSQCSLISFKSVSELNNIATNNTPCPFNMFPNLVLRVLSLLLHHALLIAEIPSYKPVEYHREFFDTIGGNEDHNYLRRNTTNTD